MNNLAKIQVKRLHANSSVNTVINKSLQIKTTGDANVTAPPVTDVVLTGMANTLQNMQTGSKASPPTYTSSQVNVQNNKVIVAYNKDMNYIESVANDVAIAAGDVNAGIEVVTRCGAGVKGKSAKSSRKFKVKQSGVGAVEITTKSAGRKAGYMREYGLTSAKGLVPATLSPMLYSLEADVYIENLQSGKIYGFREAIVLPVSRKGSTSKSGVAATGRGLTPTLSTKAHKASFSDGANHYVWSDWIYVVIL